MADMELCRLSAVAVATAVRRKELSPVGIVKNALDRIEAVNPRLNCFCFVYPDEALAAARRAEAAVMRGDALGPLHGVPIAFKDMTPTKGKRTTLGSYAYENWIPDHDATIVERLLGAGAIMVGKTTTSELAYAFQMNTPLWGITRNPWNLDRAPGGSSGGSAAAVAAGCVPLAEGCDAGGSIRLPASFTGIVGLKPSLGRIPFEIFPSQFDSFTSFGPLAWHVSDAALFLDAAQGPDDRDFSSLPALPAVDPPRAAGLEGVRLAFTPDFGYYAVDPEVAANTRAMVATLRSLGAEVDEIELSWTRDLNEAGWLHWDVYAALMMADRLDEFRDRMEPDVVAAVERGRQAKAVDFKRVELVRTRLAETIAPILARYDALVSPTSAQPAIPIDSTEADFGHDDENGKFCHYEMTFPFNMLTLPALSVPSGFTGSGLPTGFQIAGRRHDDATPLRIGHALEQALNWTDNRPPI